MERSGEVRCVRIGVFRVLGTQEGQSATEGPVEEATCVSCGEGISREGVELNGETVDVILKALLLEEEEVSTCRLWTCVGCYSSLHSFLNLIRKLEELRVTFNDQRRRLGLHVVLRSLRKSQESYDGWLAAVKSVEDVFPSIAARRLRKTCSVAVGTDEEVGAEDEEVDTSEVEIKDEGMRCCYDISDLADLRDIRIDCVESLFQKDFNEQEILDVSTEGSCEDSEDYDYETSRKRRKSKNVSEKVSENNAYGSTRVETDAPDLLQPNPAEGQKAEVEVITLEDSDDEEPSESSPAGQWTRAQNISESTKTKVGESSVGSQLTFRRRRCRRWPFTIRSRRNNTEGDDESFDGREYEDLSSSDDEYILSEHEKSESDDAECVPVGRKRKRKRMSTFARERLMKSQRCDSQRVKNPVHRSRKKGCTFRCEFCPEVFRRMTDVRSHCYKNHKSVKELENTCVVCYRAYTTPKGLETHMKKKHEDFKCSWCGKYFRGRNPLQMHVKVHLRAGEQPFSCGVCRRMFKQEGSLMTHMIIHSEERPLVSSGLLDK